MSTTILILLLLLRSTRYFLMLQISGVYLVGAFHMRFRSLPVLESLQCPRITPSGFNMGNILKRKFCLSIRAQQPPSRRYSTKLSTIKEETVQPGCTRALITTTQEASMLPMVRQQMLLLRQVLVKIDVWTLELGCFYKEDRNDQSLLQEQGYDGAKKVRVEVVGNRYENLRQQNRGVPSRPSSSQQDMLYPPFLHSSLSLTLTFIPWLNKLLDFLRPDIRKVACLSPTQLKQNHSHGFLLLDQGFTAILYVLGSIQVTSPRHELGKSVSSLNSTLCEPQTNSIDPCLSLPSPYFPFVFLSFGSCYRVLLRVIRLFLGVLTRVNNSGLMYSNS